MLSLLNSRINSRLETIVQKVLYLCNDLFFILPVAAYTEILEMCNYLKQRKQKSLPLALFSKVHFYSPYFNTET